MTTKCKKISWILARSFKHCYKAIIVNSLILIFTTSLSFLLGIVNKNIINELVSCITTKHLSNLFVLLLLLYVVLYFVQSSGGFLMVLGGNYHRFNVDVYFHGIFMKKSYGMPQVKFLDKKFMDRYTYIGQNTSGISDFIDSILRLFISNIGSIIVLSVIFLKYEPKLLLFLIMVSFISALSSKYVSKKEYILSKKQINKQRYDAYYKEILTGKQAAKELRIYNFKDFILKKWDAVYRKIINDRLELSLEKNRILGVSAILKILAKGFAILILLSGVYNKKYDLGTFVFLFGLIDMADNKVNTFINTIVVGVFKDMNYLCDYYDYVNDSVIGEIVPNQELIYSQFKTLKLNQVSFGYESMNKNAVDKVSLEIEKGQVVCLFGYNGSGKTTLSKMILGCLSPQSGEIYLNEVDVYNKNNFCYFGNAPQEISRFSLSIKEFVCLGNIDLIDSEESIQEAYKRGRVNSLLAKYDMNDRVILSKEYDESGIDLSGGEWQLLSIGSAYMGMPEILIMDEPTASIDPMKENEIINDFRRNLDDKTAILISHRVEFARIADIIVMMHDGEIKESGTHDELISQNGYYAKLFLEQQKLYM